MPYSYNSANTGKRLTVRPGIYRLTTLNGCAAVERASTFKPLRKSVVNKRTEWKRGWRAGIVLVSARFTFRRLIIHGIRNFPPRTEESKSTREIVAPSAYVFDSRET